MESRFEEQMPGLSDDSVQNMLALVERLRPEGGALDDSAIQAVAEATGAPLEYVRLAEQMRSQRDDRKKLFGKLKSAFITLDPDVRRYVVSGVLATNIALLQASETATQVGISAAGHAVPDPSPIFGILKIVAITLALYNIGISRESRTAALSGAITAGAGFAAYVIFAYVMRIPGSADSTVLIPFVLAGALGGLLLQRLVGQYQGKLGLRDPVKERQELLRQLEDLRSKLLSGEQSMTFLSVDMVGSTRMKQNADPLSVEFTFTEYHSFVEMVTKRYGGRVHSTAGDGITCAFDHPQQAFASAKNIQTGIIELNTFRNKIGVPIVLRCGIHSGTVVTPNAADVKSLNFAEVIDIAAHVQKECPPGGVAVTESAACMLPGGMSSVGPQRIQASGVTAVVWQPKNSMAALVGAGSPSLPSAEPAEGR